MDRKRKNRRKKQVTGQLSEERCPDCNRLQHAKLEDAPQITRAKKKEMIQLISQLFEICSYAPPAAEQDIYEEYLHIHGLVEKLRKIQLDQKIPSVDRKNHTKEFWDWLQKQGAVSPNLEICEAGDSLGIGLRTTVPRKAAELVLEVPRCLMLTADTAKASDLGALVEEDGILVNMPNILLAIHLLCEHLNPCSLWSPYTHILPSSFSTPLYFTPEEMRLLKGSTTFVEAMCQYRNITRQYTYFYKLFQNNPKAKNLPIRNRFCYDDYRWAVSAVMTRQNKIPGKSDSSLATSGHDAQSEGNVSSNRLALIPLWDMCNHENGEPSTDFDEDSDCCRCYAFRDFEAGEEIKIFYGARSNAEFFLHSGFVYPDNLFDSTAIPIGISKNDPLYAMKAELLARLGLIPSRLFKVYRKERGPVSGDLLAFARIFCMTEDELVYLLLNEEGREKIAGLRDFEKTVFSPELEEKSWLFLRTRAALVVYSANYPDAMTKGTDESRLSPHSRMVLAFRRSERLLLQCFLSHCEDTCAQLSARSRKQEAVEAIRRELQHTQSELDAELRSFCTGDGNDGGTRKEPCESVVNSDQEITSLRMYGSDACTRKESGEGVVNGDQGDASLCTEEKGECGDVDTRKESSDGVVNGDQKDAPSKDSEAAGTESGPQGSPETAADRNKEEMVNNSSNSCNSSEKSAANCIDRSKGTEGLANVS